MTTRPHPPNSFDELARRWRPDLLAAARKVMGDSDLVEDVAHSVLLRLLGRDWLGIESPGAYLRSAVYREALRVLAFQRRSVPLPDGAYPLRSNAPGPLQRTVALEQGSLLRAQLRRLPERCGAVMTLKLVEGLSHGEIASRLGISQGAVDKQVARAKEYLRRWLQVGPDGDIEWCPHLGTGGASRLEGLMGCSAPVPRVPRQTLRLPC